MQGIPNITKKDPKKIRNILDDMVDALVKDFDPSEKRRSRFLDHLLARFGEVFTGDFLKRLLPEGSERELLEKKIINNKAEFLRNYEVLSKDRGKAINYKREGGLWESDNVSGFKKRIALLMNLGEIELPQKKGRMTKSPGSSTRLNQSHNRFLANSPLLTAVNWSEKSEKKGAAKSASASFPFKVMLKHGSLADNYEVKAHKNGTFSLFLNQGLKKQYLICEQGSFEACIEARDNLIHRLNSLNRISEGFFVVEHILLRPYKPQGHRMLLEVDFSEFSLPQDFKFNPEKHWFMSPRFSNLETLESIGTDLLIFGADERNYKILDGGGEDKFFVLISRENTPVFITPAGFTREEANEFKKITAFVINKIKEEAPSRINDWVSFESERVEDQFRDNDFYSLKLSLVMPAWPSRFQDEEFRRFFELVVAMNVPAHITVDYRWLEFDEMSQFEKVFKNWLDAKAAPEPDFDQQQSLSVQLGQFLTQNTQENAGEKTGRAALVQKRLSAEYFKAIKDELGYSYFFEQSDFQIFEGIGVKVEALLKNSGINDWEALMGTEVSELRNFLKSGGLGFATLDPESWPKQAKLAFTGRWKELERFQKKMTRADGRKGIYESPSKVDRYLDELRSDPKHLLKRLEYWQKLPDPPLTQVPFTFMEAVIDAYSYKFVLDNSNLSILDGIDKVAQRKLQNNKFFIWEQLSIIKPEEIQLLLFGSEDQEANRAKAQYIIKQAQMATSGSWDAPQKLQKEANPQELTPLEFEFNQAFETVRDDFNLYLTKLKEFMDESFPEPLLQALIEEAGYGVLLNRNNLQIIEGIGAKTEQILKEGQINTWSRLANASTKKINELLKAVGLSPYLFNPDSWKTQAKLATENKWEDLVELQKEFQQKDKLKVKPSKVENKFEEWLAKNAVIE